MSTSTPEQAVLKNSNLKGFLTVLQAIKPSSSKQVCNTSVIAAVSSCLGRLTALLLTLQVCTLILGTEGLWVKWEDDSKSLQSSLFLGPQVCAMPCVHPAWPPHEP